MKDIRALSPKLWAVIDLDTGTVLGPNVVAVPWNLSDNDREDILSSDSVAWQYGLDHGQALYKKA